ncbi:MAG: hypothetical protein SWH61_08975 [Thermodesulfobacteriota bacterium]|nr:hypothetical protein [Thermodesulfobacteriota bacterium]
MALNNPGETVGCSDRFLIVSLFFLGLGYALLSYCLYRILGFISVSVPFFVLYIGIGFPVGAWLVSRFIGSMKTGFRLALILLPVSGIGILMTGVAGIYFWQAIAGIFFTSLNISSLMLTILTLTAISLPFFIVWGGVEYISFKLVLANHRMRPFFYVLTISSLLGAFILGSLSIPCFGLLQTIALVPVLALVSLYFVSPRINSVILLVAVICCLSIWFAVGRYETRFTKLLYYDKVIQTIQSMPVTDKTGITENTKTTLLKSLWGKYCHLAFIHHHEPASPLATDRIICCYDGFPIWETSPALSDGLFDNIIFEHIKKEADICIIGAGGGKQVAHAIAAGARKVVAIDIIPEIFQILKNEFSWTNGNLYNLSRVETVAADGLQYMRESDRTFDYIVLPSAESFAFILKSFFEPGQHIHSQEAFRVFRDHLNPGGELIVFKDIDKDGSLFRSFAKTMKTVGFNVSGFIIPSKPFDHFMLVASLKSPPRTFSKRALTHLRRFNAYYFNFQKVSPKGVVLTANSPWYQSFFGNLVPVRNLKSFFIIVVVSVIMGAGIVWFLQKDPNHTIRRFSWDRLFFALAGMFIGINAIYLENGIIFWFIMNLVNPLTAFFVGSSVFLLLWGCANLRVAAWTYLTALAVMGVLLIFIMAWQTYSGFVGLLLMIAGSGFCFSFLVLRFEAGLLTLFVFDGLGAIIGGLLGIGIPIFYGLKTYFDVLPWLVLATLVTTIIAGILVRRAPLAGAAGDTT